jgi:histidyl-tRNA synthetase
MATAPKGKPSDEVKAKLDAQKAARTAFCNEIREKYSLDKKAFGDKKIVKDLIAKAEAAKAAEDGISLVPPSGTRDFYPDEMRWQSWLFEQFRAVAREMGFQEYDAPVLEATKLYQRKAGEEITEQMYNFTDKEGYEVTLRPEMTPSLARMVLARMQAASGEIRDLLPFKWFSIPQCWRFESCQRGRKREHYQWNMDIVGPQMDNPPINAFVYLLFAIVSFFKRLGIKSTDVGIKINSRKVLQQVLQAYGVGEDQFAPVCVVVDKLDKIGSDAVKSELLAIKVPEESADKILAVLHAKTVEEMESFLKQSSSMNCDAIDELRQLFQLCADYGIADWLIFDASVVRGLAYYTGVVWEAFDRRGILRAICGGGRYDRLLSLYGATKQVPCVGFGFGDCVVLELLKELDLMPDLPRTVDYVVAAYDQETYGHSLKVAQKLRQNGASVDVLLLPVGKKVGKKGFDYANRAGAKRVAFIGPEEWNNGELVRIKDMGNGDADDRGVDVPFAELDKVDSYFAGDSSLPQDDVPLGGDTAAMERCGKVEEWLLKHDLRSVLQTYVSQVVLNQGDDPLNELAEMLLQRAQASAEVGSDTPVE